MNKRLLFAIGGIVILLVLGGTWFFVRGNPTPPPTPLPSANTPPLFASPVPSGGLFTNTPPPTSVVNTDICPAAWGGRPDTDGDGLPDFAEKVYNTNYQNTDTDGDSHSDGDEVRNGYDPAKAGSTRLDRDGDGLLDNEECQWHTDALNPDTDADGYQDGAEVKACFNPLVAGDGKGSDRITCGAPSSPTPAPSTPQPTTAPSSPRPTTTPTSYLKTITQTDLHISEATDANAINTYLAAISKTRPVEFTDGKAISDALITAFSGDTTKLQNVRNRIAKYVNDLVATTVPRRAVSHHLLLISLTQYMYNRLGDIQTNVKTNPQQALTIATQMRDELPGYINQLQAAQKALATTAQ